MKISQKFLCFLAIIFGVFFICIGKVSATAPTLSPSSGVAGSAFTISDSGFANNWPVTTTWDAAVLDNSATSESGNYSFVAHVPSDASVGEHTVTITSAVMGFGPRNNWISHIIPRVLASDGTALFTVTPPPVTPPPETPVANTNTATTTTTNNLNSNTGTTAQSNLNSNQATAEPAAVSTNTNTNETAQTEPINEVKKEAKVCYFPWWLWLLLILITVVNLVLFWLRYWKKKPKLSE